MNTTLKFVVAIAFSAAIIAQCKASTFTSAAWNDDASSGISSTSPYTHAYNFGSASNALINGVPFTGISGTGPAVVGRFSTSGYDGIVNGDTNNVGSPGGSQTVATDFVYNGANGSEQLSITGLRPYLAYRTTIYSVDWDGGPGARVMAFNDGGPNTLIDQGQFGADNGIRVTYDYTADGAGTATVNIVPQQAASFHNYGFANEALTTMPLTGLFNTGVDGGGTPLPDGTVGDPHYSLISVPGGTTDTRVRTLAGGFPIGPWLGDNATSAWIGPDNDGALNGPGGDYSYRTTFNVGIGGSTGLFAGRIQGRVTADNTPVNIFLNGSLVSGPLAVDFTNFNTLFDINALLPAGLNTLDFVVTNGGGPTGLRVEFTSAIVEVPEPGSLALLASGLAGLAVARRRRAR